MDKIALDDLILQHFPHFIAENYYKLLNAKISSEERVRLALHIYQLGLRSLAIGLVSQYLIRDRWDITDTYLLNLLSEKFSNLTLDLWQRLLFLTLRVYEGNKERFFIPELYDFYWDTSTLPHKRRTETEQPFSRLSQIFMEIILYDNMQYLPKDEQIWKYWEKEVIDLLRQILSDVAFLSNYDLIRIIERIQEDEKQTFIFELHKGVEITIKNFTIPKALDLRVGHFYLRKGIDKFLLLNPFLVFWKEQSTDKVVLLADTGIYDRVIYERFQYLLANKHITVVDEYSQQAFNKLLDLIDEKKKLAVSTKQITWWQLCDICEDITQHRMASVRQKYRSELYLQRSKTHNAFLRFLRSEQRCFVLIGKSGVGKSSFAWAIKEDLERSFQNICILMYDANQLRTNISITEIIKGDVVSRVLSSSDIVDIWKEISYINDINSRLFLLYVDAINENSQAVDLLDQLNELVQTPWPWLKIAFSSRPETWKVIKRHIKLAEALYYRETNSEMLGVELEAFNYSDKLDPFSRSELSDAFTIYQQSFNLQTDYTALSSTMRELLRDPLSLWIVAKTYETLPVPNSLKATELIEKYLENLFNSGRLSREDLVFLEKRLLPLMISENHYSNTLTNADIDMAGEGLFEAIYSEQTLSTGYSMNQSFTNLMDAEILALQEQGREQKIYFKYERFYEYFGGLRIFELAQRQIDQPQFYSEVINETTNKPFLWGAVKYALLRTLQGPHADSLDILYFTDQERIRELMVSVLIELGQDYLPTVEKILKKLMPDAERSGRWQSIWHLLGRANQSIDVFTRNSKKIAIEVASSLGIQWVLCTGALQPDPTIRTVAVSYTYHLWQRNRDLGYMILERLADEAVPGLVPNLVALESMFGLSLIIFFDHAQDIDVTPKLQHTWQKMIGRLFGVNEAAGYIEKILRSAIRERTFSFAINSMFHFFQQMPPQVVNYPELENFFQFSKAEKALFCNLVRYIDNQENYSREQLEKDLLAVLKMRHFFFEGVAILILTDQAMRSPLEFLPFLKEFFEEAQQDSTPNPYVYAVVPQVLWVVLNNNPMQDEIFNFFVYTAEVCQEYYTQHTEIPQLQRTNLYEGANAMLIGAFIVFHYKRTGQINSEWVVSRINNAMSQNDIPFFKKFFSIDMPLISIEYRMPQVALQTLNLFFNDANLEIMKLIKTFLARLRVHFPNEVDNFLHEQNVPNSFRQQVYTSEVSENVGSLIGYRAFDFLLDEMIVNSPKLRSWLKITLLKTADYDSGRKWLNHVFRGVINMIYGAQVLKLDRKN